MEKVREYLASKDIVFSADRYLIAAMGAMAKGLFASLLIGTILSTAGTQLHLGFLSDIGTISLLARYSLTFSIYPSPFQHVPLYNLLTHLYSHHDYYLLSS